MGLGNLFCTGTYNFLEEAQQDEIAAEIKFRAFAKTNGAGL
jgi:hypothetical protein